MRTIRDRFRRQLRMRAACPVLLMVLIAGCSTAPPPQPQQVPAAPQIEQAWCASSCPSGYQCSPARVAGILTGLCVAGPTQCTSDADCLKVSAMPGTKPIRYVCDKRSGAFADKTGGAISPDRGTCMPTYSTGLETQ
jgi:hypothetical protein